MPRSNRPRGGRPDRVSPEERETEDLDLSRVLYGRLRIESKRNGSWNVQSVSPTSASKYYTCPGCGQAIAPGIGHVVAWRADGLMGETDDLAARRHWHSHCWKIT